MKSFITYLGFGLLVWCIYSWHQRPENRSAALDTTPFPTVITNAVQAPADRKVEEPVAPVATIKTKATANKKNVKGSRPAPRKHNAQTSYTPITNVWQ